MKWTELALTQPVGGATRAKAAFAAGTMSLNQGDRQVALGHFNEALELYRAAGDEAGAARCMWGVIVAKDDIRTGLTGLQEALRISERVGDDANTASCLRTISRIALLLGDRETPRSSIESALAILRRRGDLRGMAAWLRGLGEAAEAGNDLASARRGSSPSSSCRPATEHASALLAAHRALASTRY